jgi:hypothetical protein
MAARFMSDSFAESRAFQAKMGPDVMTVKVHPNRQT